MRAPLLAAADAMSDWLDVYDNTPPSIRLHRKLGFQPVTTIYRKPLQAVTTLKNVDESTAHAGDRAEMRPTCGREEAAADDLHRDAATICVAVSSANAEKLAAVRAAFEEAPAHNCAKRRGRS